MKANWVPLRSRAEQLLARIRSLGWRETLVIERESLRRILKSTLAATIAWLAAELIDSPRPALASLAAILVVQVTVRATLARSIQLTVAVALGLGSSLLIGSLLGTHWWTITLIVLAGLIAGELLRLGVLSPQVAISAMLALSLGRGYGVERTIDTALGALIGALVNGLIVPPSLTAEGSRTLRVLGEDLGALLADIGAGMAKAPGADSIRRWLDRARDLSTDSRNAISAVKQGQESLQYNPLARGDLAQLNRLTEARRALDHAISQTRGIVRSLMDLAQPIDDPLVTQTLGELGAVLVAGSPAVTAFGRLQERPTSAGDRYDLNQARQAAEDRAGAIAGLLAGMEASAGPARSSAARLLTSIYVDIDRLLDEIDISDTGAHRAAVEVEVAPPKTD